jgi:predicted Ser/Thr protein kinase
MPLSGGTRLGPYEIVAQIGAGGMGEVYKARDTRLDRTVAIKTSKAQFSERFAREARAVAALNHPHICTLHDVGPNYLVMEYIEGAPLKGPLPLDQALKYASQICDALDAAHKKNVTHRDLKPGNILVTKAGVKLLDFGLARVSCADATVTMGVMGTPAYMSPEQWEGKPGDARSDIYAFGCVLYEMLTGKRAAQGRMPVQPPALESVIADCLEKDPDDRWQSARDVKKGLDLVGQVPDLPPQARGPRHLGWMAAAAVLAVAAAVSLWAPWRVASTAQQPIVKLDLDLGATVSESNVGTDTILSPDGTRLVFVSQGADGKSRLSTRRLDQPKPAELPGTDGAYGPFFSPDGLSVGFFAGGKLKKIALEGGDPVILCDAPAGRGATWSEDGSVIAALDTVRGLALIPAAGGPPTPLTELENGEAGHRFPHALPGGKAVLFTFSNTNGNYEEGGIAAVSLKDHHRKNILDHAGMSPRYLPSGHLVYVTKGSLFAVPFDAERWEVRGEAKPVLESVAGDSNYGSAQVSYAQAGRFIYRAGRTEVLRDVLWLSADGRTQPLWPEPTVAAVPRFSPDGRRLAMFILNGPTQDLWVYDIDKTTKTRLTSGLAGRDPVWSHDGQLIVFQSPGGIFWTRADGAGKPQLLVASKTYLNPGSFSPDGRRLIYAELLSGGGGAIKTVPVENATGQLRAGQPEVFLQPTATSNVYPGFSHDGRWLAYNDAESGSFEVYVRAFPDRGAKWQISNSGGGFPVWSPNGHELFYRSPDNRIMVVNYSIRGAEFSADKPRLWSDRRLFNYGNAPTFDLAPDGKRFAAMMPSGGDQPPPNQNHVTLLLNFFDEVRRRVPAGK